MPTRVRVNLANAQELLELPGLGPDEVQAIVRSHCDWIASGWQGRRPTAEQVVGLGQMYVSDHRFAANYGGVAGAAYVRDAMIAYAEDNLD